MAAAEGPQTPEERLAVLPPADGEMPGAPHPEVRRAQRIEPVVIASDHRFEEPLPDEGGVGTHAGHRGHTRSVKGCRPAAVMRTATTWSHSAGSRS